MKANLFDAAFPFMELLQRQAGTLQKAVKELESILARLSTAPEKCAGISELVAQGELRCREIERELALTFLEPFDREDIRELNRAFQRGFGAVGAVSSRIGLYGFGSAQEGAAALCACQAEICTEIAPLLAMIVREGNSAEACERARKLKREADMFVLVGLGELYESAGSGLQSLLEAMKWSQIYDRLEELGCCLEQVINVIEGIILKQV
jgi:uncharacterized protein